MELVKDQFVIIQPDVSKYEDEENTENKTMRVIFGAVHEIFDDMYIFAKDDGGMFVLHIPTETRLVVPVFKDGKPVIVKRTLRGKYKFPKVEVVN